MTTTPHPSAHANPLATSGERVRNQTDSSHVAPQEPCPQPCEHLSAEDAREGRDCREHPCTCPVASSPDREKLTEEARAVAGPKSLYAHTSVAHLLIRLADALAAQPVFDPEKVAEVIEYYYDVPGDRLDLIARAICEAAKRGELSA